MSDLFDFGFTACNEEELEAVQKATAQVQETTASASDYQERMNKLYNAIIPLLDNLSNNEDKSYIYWPNRKEKIAQFRAHIQKIVGDGTTK